MSHNEKVNRAARKKWNRKKKGERNEEDRRICLKLASFQTEACDGKENVDIHSINKFLVVPRKGCEKRGLLSHTYLPTSSIFCTQNSHQKYNYIITQVNEYTYVYISTLCYGRYKDK